MATQTSAPQKRKVTLCPTCGGAAHRDPVTGRYTKHVEPAPAPEPERKRGLLRRRRG